MSERRTGGIRSTAARHSRRFGVVVAGALTTLGVMLALTGVVGAQAASAPTLDTGLFDTDIVLVAGHGYPAGATVSVDAIAGGLGGTATATAGGNGRFLLGFQIPDTYTGTVAVTASSGTATTNSSVSVTANPATPAPTQKTPVTAANPNPIASAAGAAAAAAASPSPATRASGATLTGNLSGLPWMSGVHTSNELQPFLDFGTWRGRPIDAALVYTDRTSGWPGLVNPTWPVDTFAAFPGRLIISQPMFPQGQGDLGSCASGAYDSQWKSFGSFLVAHKRADAIVRIGWEFNGTYMYWHTASDPGSFKTCFQQVSAAIKSADPSVLIDWTINAHNSPVPSSGNPYDAYPGDGYVDIVGIDAYDMFPTSPNQAAWDKQCNGVNGLCYMMNFARGHGKKVGVGEWGVVSCGGDPGGDNPFYIQKMYDTFKANTDVMGYETYYHDSASGVCSTIENGGQNPRSAAMYKSLFGTA